MNELFSHKINFIWHTIWFLGWLILNIVIIYTNDSQWLLLFNTILMNFDAFISIKEYTLWKTLEN